MRKGEAMSPQPLLEILVNNLEDKVRYSDTCQNKVFQQYASYY